MSRRLWLLVTTALSLALLAPGLAAAQATGSGDRECKLGTEHAICLWSEPGFKGELTTLRKSTPRTAIDSFKRVRSYKVQDALIAATGDSGGLYIVLSAGHYEDADSDPFADGSDGWNPGVVATLENSGMTPGALREQFRCEDGGMPDSCGTWTEHGDGTAELVRQPDIAASAPAHPADKTLVAKRTLAPEECRLGLEHSVCLWSEPGYQGELVALPLGYDRMVLSHLNFEANSLKTIDTVTIYGDNPDVIVHAFLAWGPFSFPDMGGMWKGGKLDVLEYRDLL